MVYSFSPQPTVNTVYGSVLLSFLYLTLYSSPFCISVPSTLSGVSQVALIIACETPIASSIKPVVNVKLPTDSGCVNFSPTDIPDIAELNLKSSPSFNGRSPTSNVVPPLSTP